MPTPLPTDAELAILVVLWARGPSTVREVHEALLAERKTAYTTTLKIMQTMHDKGLLRRNDSQRSHVYRAAVAQRNVERSLVSDLVHKAFSGSAARLVQRALSSRKTSKKELDEIRALLDELEKGSR